MNARNHSERPLLMKNRKKVRRLDKVRTLLLELAEEEEALTKELKQRVEAESIRLSVPVPNDAFILDVLELVDVVEPSYWKWLGVTNNKDLPSVRFRKDDGRSSERSVVRVLAEAFGVIDEDWEGVLYPLNGIDNVNPWQREKREYPEGKYRGFHDRYKF